MYVPISVRRFSSRPNISQFETLEIRRSISVVQKCRFYGSEMFGRGLLDWERKSPEASSDDDIDFRGRI